MNKLGKTMEKITKLGKSTGRGRIGARFLASLLLMVLLLSSFSHAASWREETNDIVPRSGQICVWNFTGRTITDVNMFTNGSVYQPVVHNADIQDDDSKMYNVTYGGSTYQYKKWTFWVNVENLGSAYVSGLDVALIEKGSTFTVVYQDHGFYLDIECNDGRYSVRDKYMELV